MKKFVFNPIQSNFPITFNIRIKRKNNPEHIAIRYKPNSGIAKLHKNRSIRITDITNLILTSLHLNKNNTHYLILLNGLIVECQII